MGMTLLGYRLGQAVLISMNVISFAAIILFLPLTHDISGRPAMLALSVSFILYYFVYGTLSLISRNTRFRTTFSVLSTLQPAVITALLIATLNVYSTEGTTTPLDTVTDLWENVLLSIGGPLFVVAEGIASLVCIQAFSRFTMHGVRVKARHADISLLLLLIASAGVYVISSYFLLLTVTSLFSPVTASLLAIAITSVLFLSAIGLSSRKTTVVETSLVFSYVVGQFRALKSTEEVGKGIWEFLRPEGQGVQGGLPPAMLRSFEAVAGFISVTFGAAINFLGAASSALPLSVLIGLFYRLAVLYAASSIILALKRRNEGPVVHKRRLREEDSPGKLITVLLAYSRLMLISVYTHLLLLNDFHYDANFWRWLSIFVSLGLWALELKIGEYEVDP